MDKNLIHSSSKSLGQHVRKTKLNKGYALIFNHKKFNQSLRQNDRRGTEQDVKALEDVFKLFHVEVIVKNDLSITEIDSEVKRLQCFDFTPYECLIIVILTHGKEKNFLCASDCTYDLHDRVVNEIVTPNKSLIGMPKIFLIQACKGVQVLQSSMETDNLISYSSIAIPYITEMFFAFSTYEGFVSNRDIRSGGLFIKSFCKMLREYGSTEVITKIMERVTKNLAKNNKFWQVPTTVTTMTKPFIFGDIAKGSVSTNDEIFMRMFRKIFETKQSSELIAQITELVINKAQVPIATAAAKTVKVSTVEINNKKLIKSNENINNFSTKSVEKNAKQISFSFDETTNPQDLTKMNSKSDTLNLNSSTYEEKILIKTLYANVNLKDINFVENHKDIKVPWEQCNHNIHYLLIDNCDINVNQIFSILQMAENLVALEISDCRIFASIKQFPHKYVLKNLIKFKLNSPFGNNIYYFFNKLLEITPNLRSLDISTRGWNPTDPLYAMFIEKTVKINNLKLEEYIFTTDVSQFFTKSISKKQTLITYLNVAGSIKDNDMITICNNIPNLRALHLNNCSQISDSGVMDLWKMKNLRSLCLNNCLNVKANGFIEGLKEKNDNMQTLELMSWNSSPNHKVLFHITKQFKCIQQLKIYAIDAIFENEIHSVWRNLRQLKKLQIRCSEILASDFTYTGRDIKNNSELNQCSIARVTGLTHLYLDFPNKISIKTLKEISKLKGLIHLKADFSKSKIKLTDLEVLSECKLLEYLNITLKNFYYQTDEAASKKHFSRIKSFIIK